MFSNFYQLDSQNENFCCIRKSTTKRQQHSDWRSDFTWYSKGYRKCMFVGSLTQYIAPINCAPGWICHVPKTTNVPNLTNNPLNKPLYPPPYALYTCPNSAHNNSYTSMDRSFPLNENGLRNVAGSKVYSQWNNLQVGERLSWLQSILIAELYIILRALRAA